MGNSTFDNGHLDEIFLGILYALGNSSGDFTSLTKTNTDDTLTITNYYDSSESEGATALGDFDYAIDSNESIL